MVPWLVENAVVAAVLAGVVGLLCRTVRLRPAVCHALWLVVLLKFLAPPVIRWPWPLAPPTSHQDVPTFDPTEPVYETPDQGFPSESVVVEPDSPLELPEVAIANEPTSEMGSETTWAPWLPEGSPTFLGLWGVGMFGMLSLQIVRLLRFRWRVARGGSSLAWLSEEVNVLAGQLGVRAPVVRVLPGLPSPVVWSLGQAELLWPAELVDRLSETSRRAATVHELAHLRRRDHWVGWLQLVGSCVWWWNPVFWYVRRQIGRAAELACDAWVVATLPGARRAYAEALLEVCELQSRQAAPAPVLGMSGPRQDLERRLVMIMRESVPARLPLRALGGILLLALIVFPAWSQSVPTQGDPVSPAASADPFVARVAQSAPPAAGASADNEQRLRRLEATLQELLKEVKDLRGEKVRTTATTPAKAPQPNAVSAPKPTPNTLNWGNTTASPATARWVYEKVEGGQAQPIALTRATYKLPKDKAEALGKLMDLQPKTSAIEYKVEADGIVVTAPPDAQHTVGEFIDLLQGKFRPRTVHGQYLTTPYGAAVVPARPAAPALAPTQPHR